MGWMFSKFVAGAILTAGVALASSTPSMLVQAQTISATPDALTEKYTDWEVRCRTVAVEGQSNARVCEMVQELRQAQGGKRVLAVSVRAAEGGNSGTMTLITPFGLLLSAGVTIEVDDKSLTSAPFRTCIPAGCISLPELSTEVLSALMLAEKANVVMTPTRGEPLRVAVSMLGFTTAWNRLQEL